MYFDDIWDFWRKFENSWCCKVVEVAMKLWKSTKGCRFHLMQFGRAMKGELHLTYKNLIFMYKKIVSNYYMCNKKKNNEIKQSSQLQWMYNLQFILSFLLFLFQKTDKFALWIRNLIRESRLQKNRSKIPERRNYAHLCYWSNC